MSWYSPKDFAPVLDGFKEKYPDLEIDFQNVPNEGNQYQQKLNLLANSNFRTYFGFAAQLQILQKTDI